MTRPSLGREISKFSPSRSHEQQANESAKTLSDKSQSPVLPAAPFSTPEAIEAAGAESLTPADKAVLESHLGQDFSSIRIHSGSEANALAESLNANAFTVGRDVFFNEGQYNPGTPNGQALLAHELTHAAQQAQSGQPSIQMEPKKAKGGIGAAPPKEPFITAKEPGAEDGAVMFGFDNADLTKNGEDWLNKQVEAHKKGPVTVVIHGYASSEGEGEYNLNLSAHRGAVIKAYLESKLPPNSKFTIYAHGETTSFGPLEKNRRAGLTIKDGVDAPVAKKDGWSLDPTTLQEKKKDDAPSPFVPKPLFPTLQPGWTLTPPQAPWAPKPPVAPPHLGPAIPTFNEIDWESMRAKFTDRGLTPTDRDISSIEKHWKFSYDWFLRFKLSRDLAILGANIATGLVVDDQVGREKGGALDRAAVELKTHYPDEKHLVIPFLSSDVLDAIRKKLKKSDKDDYFFRF